jgi:DNA-directed RNA polymerase specialized sigma subunit
MKPDYKQLIVDNKRLIESEASKYSQFIPKMVVLAEAYHLANEAAETFDEKHGVKFTTHLVNVLKKLSRLSTKYGGAVRVPEMKQFKIQKINVAEEELRNELGRAPSIAEISDKMGIGIADIHNTLKSRKKTVNLNNLAHTPIFVDNMNDEWLHFVYHDLTDRDKIIMEHKIGFGGKKVLDNYQIAKELNIPYSVVVSRSRMIAEKIQEGMK